MSSVLTTLVSALLRWTVTASDRVMFRVMISRGDIQFRIGEGTRIPRVISSVEVNISIREQDS
jgi:hypothetical protein